MARRMSIWLCLIAAISFVVAPAFAAVQNVKVSGDIALWGASRDNFDLSDTRGSDETSSANNDEVDAITSQVRLRVDADLTDNVQSTIRLLSERPWTQNAQTTDEIAIDLASMTLKEFLYSPLTLTLGRQELRYGNALVVGDPDTNITAAGTAFGAPIQDLSIRKAFDAIKAVFDYNPLTVDLIFAKVNENAVGLNDDVNLAGINLKYAFDKNNTVLEGYYFGKLTGAGAAGMRTLQGLTAADRRNKTEKIHTIGARVSTEPVENLNLQAETAFQIGSYDPTLDMNSLSTAQTGNRRAWAAQVIGDYKFKAKHDPRLTATYSYFSGEDNNRASGDYNGWNAMFEDQTLGDIANKIFAPSNAHVVTVTAQAKPLDDLTASLTYAYFTLAKKLNRGGNFGGSGPEKPLLVLSGLAAGTSYNMAAGKSRLGQEVDLHLMYDYTEDVQFALVTGVFIPGNAFAKPENQDPATQALAMAKVTF